MIKNFLTAEKQRQPNSHDGIGPVDLYEIWSKDEFQSNCDFVDRVVIPPQTEVGYHRHGNNEEMYIILSGEGLMTIEGEEHRIKKGDMILNPAHGSHGLLNDSDEEIDILVIQISLND